MADYGVEIDLSNPNTSHAQVVDLVGPDRTVLDVGCWTGDLARVLVDRGCRVSGVELDAEAAQVAAEHLDRVVVTDLDSSLLSEHFAPGAFDVIIFADVLEHLRRPDVVLRDAVDLIGPGGRVVISIPNVTHGSLRLALMQGRWRYSETGLLDHTHIQFFTRKRLVELVEAAGLVVDDLRGTLADPLGVEVAVDARRLPAVAVDWVRHQPDALVYQFQLSAVRRSHDAERSVDDLVAPVPVGEVCPDDASARAARADREERHDLLTVRDHVLGLQLELTTAHRLSEHRQAEIVDLRRRLKSKRAELRQLRTKVLELEVDRPSRPDGPLPGARRLLRRD